ncbi:MAG: ATP-binding cassette domain-containing protein, partial [Kiloniellaceae bacterium]
ERPLSRPGAVCFAVEDLVVRRDDGTLPVDGLSLSLGASEVLGIAGVGGNGQQELVDCLAGLLPPAAGRITLSGDDLAPQSIRGRRRRGLRVVPSDRFAAGLVRDMSIAENLALTGVREGRYGSALLLNRRRMRDAALGAIERFAIHGAAPGRTTGLLSGGNAQKVLLARELDDGLKVLVAHSPARGLDVKAAQSVHALIKQAVERGAACLLISEDLEEVLTLSHRVAVMNRGRIAGTLPVAEATPAWIGERMIGHA